MRAVIRVSNKPQYGYWPVRMAVRYGFGLIGVIILFLGGYFIREQFLSEAKSLTAPGTVINISKQNYTSGYSQAYGEVADIRFVAVDGKAYVFQRPVTLFAKPTIGQIRTVVYDKNDPQNASENPFLDILSAIIATVLAGGMFIGLAFYAKYQNTPSSLLKFSADWGLKKK